MTENVFLKVLEAGKARIKVLANLIAGELSSSFVDSPLLLLSSRGLSLVCVHGEVRLPTSSYKATHPIGLGSHPYDLFLM